MKMLITLATLVLTLATANAELAASHRASIEKLMTVLQVQKQFETSLIAGFESGLGTSSDQIKALPQEQQDKFHKAIQKVKDTLLEMMSWEKMKPDLIEAYGKNFSEKEATDIIAHMETPVGQMLVSKQASMVGDVMALTQEKMKVIMPKVMQIMQEEMTK
jgi:hypothetical protein